MISNDDFLFYVDDALRGMVDIVTGLGDEVANRRPDLPGANSPYAVLTHSLGVMEFWGGVAVAGRPVRRDRDAEFVARGPVAPLAERAEAARIQLRRDMEGMDPSAAPHGGALLGSGGEPFTTSCGGVLLHIYEELAQHRGQMELTRDVLLAPWARSA
jgi:hypothetical protein